MRKRGYGLLPSKKIEPINESPTQRDDLGVTVSREENPFLCSSKKKTDPNFVA